MKRQFLTLTVLMLLLCCSCGMALGQNETDLRRVPAKDGEGYLPILSEDSLSFSIAYRIVTKNIEYDPMYLGAMTYIATSSKSDTIKYNNLVYRKFILYDYNYLREDTLTGQLFRYYPELDTEVVTCNMALQEGDTFYLPHIQGDFYYEFEQQPYWIVDSVTYSNGRKTIWFPPVNQIGSLFSDDMRSYPACFIEGIGPSYGPFGAPPHAPYFDPLLGLLLCVHQNDSLLYMTDTVLGCYQYVCPVPEYPDVSMKLYPNPVTNTLNVEFEGTDNPQGTITVTNLTGVVVLTRECHEPVTQLDVSHLTPGLYVVSFRNAQGVVVRKFVKM